MIGQEITGLDRLKRKLKKMEAVSGQATTNVMNRIALRTVDRIEEGMAKSPPTGRTYFRQHPTRVHTASAASGRAFPRIDQRSFMASLVIKRAKGKKLFSTVGSTSRYAHALEFGTVKSAQRPWLFRSYRSATRSVAKELKEEYEALR